MVLNYKLTMETMETEPFETTMITQMEDISMMKATNNKTSPNTTVSYMSKIGKVFAYDRYRFMLHVLVQKNKHTWIQERWPVFGCDVVECKIKNYIPNLNEIFHTHHSTSYNPTKSTKQYQYIIHLR